MPQAGTVYRYLRVDADHDVSADTFALSLDGGLTWITSGITYIPAASLPPGPAAVHAANPPSAGFAGYWWRVLSGPGQPLPLATGVNEVQGRLTDSPEIPMFEWRIYVNTWE